MRFGTAALAGLAILGLLAAPHSVEADSARRRTPTTEAIQKAKPSVVSISSEKKAASTSRWPFSPEENQRPRVSGMGTGVIIDARGFILTNQHVVDKVQGIEVHLHDGTALPARLLQQDVSMDVALLKVEPTKPLTAVTLGTSADLMEGEDVMTIGNAFGYEGTIGRGIISALLRNVTLSDDQVYRNLIQTDAPINPGNSGGPLINIEGECIGLNVATRAGAQGIGFALPIDDVKRVAAEMMSTRRLVGTWHGLTTTETVIPGDTTRSVLITEVSPGSPGESAGLRPGDRLVRVGGLSISNAVDLERSLLEARSGSRQEVVAQRAGQELALGLEMQPLPKAVPDASDQVWKLLGLKTVPVQSEYVNNASNRPNKLRGGLYVQAVSANSPAARGQIQKGDILVGMNVGERHWETILADNILYIMKQSELSRASSIRYYVVRRNAIQQGDLMLGVDGAVANAATGTPR